MRGGVPHWRHTLAAVLIALPPLPTLADTGARLTFHTTESPPIWSEHLDQGGLGGEVLRAITDTARLTIVVQYLPLKRYEGLEQGNRLGNPLFFVGREFGAVIPLLVTQAVFCHHRPHRPGGFVFRTLADLEGLALGVERGSLEEKEAFERRGITVEENASAAAVLKKLREGRVDVALLLDVMVHYHISQLFPEEAADFVCSDVPRGMTPIALMLDEDTPQARHLADTMRRTLRQLIDDGTYQRILAKYYGAVGVPRDWAVRLRRLSQQYEEMPITIYGD